MAFSITKILKGLLIREENTLTPKEIEILPGGTADTKTTIQSSQTVDRTITLPDATDTLVGKATTDVLTNKTIDADSNTISNIDDGNIKAAAGIDVTKLSDGSVSNTEFGYLNGVTSSIQDQLNDKAPSTGTVTLNGVQTLTNKTIAAVDNTIQVVAAGVVATELNAALTEIEENVDNTINSLQAHEASNNTHGVSGAIVGTNNVQVLANKDIDGGSASNTSRLTIPQNTKSNLDALTRKEATLVYANDLDTLYVDNGTNLVPVGSGGGTQNFISNPDGSLGTTGWSLQTYSPAATRPTGTPSAGATQLTFAPTTTTPLNGTTSFLLTKAAANAQGQAVQAEFDLNLESRAKVLALKLNYIVDSGTFSAGSNTTDSDVIVYTSFYDGSTWSVAEPSSFKLLSNSSTISDVFSGSVQSPYNATKMRLILYVASSSTSTFALKLDASVAPSNYVYGTPIRDTVTGTPVWTNLGFTPSTNVIRFSQSGDRLIASGIVIFSSGTGSASPLTLTLPNGLVIDTTKLGSVDNTQRLGDFFWYDDSGSATQLDDNFGPVVYNSSTSVIFRMPYNSSNFTTNVMAASDRFSFEFSVPILGWSSSVQMSDSYDGRVIAMRAGRSTAQSIPNGSTTQITGFTVTNIDTTASFNATTGDYIVPSAGLYRLAGSVGFAANGTGIRAAIIRVNGSIVSETDFQPNAGATIAASTLALVNLSAGDIVTLAGYQTSGGALNTTTSDIYTYLSVEKVQGPQTISASEKVALRYYSTANGAIGTSGTIQSFATKAFDTHGAWNGNTFTAPRAGFYRATASVANNNTFNLSATNVLQIILTPSSGPSGSANFVRGNGGGNLSYVATINDMFWLNAGDTLVVQANCSQQATNQSGSSSYNYVTIESV